MSFDFIGEGGLKLNNKLLINGNSMARTLRSNGITPRKSLYWYNRFNRFGCLDPTSQATNNKEFLFFTKPDLNIFSNPNASYAELQLNSDLESNPIFTDAFKRYKKVLTQLQVSVKDADENINPFMCLLSNSVTSRLDLPNISAEDTETSANIYGTSIKYRSHSLKSDVGCDFTLSFTDTKYFEVYKLAKLYDEFIRMMKIGMVSPKYAHIINKILPDQFSIYKIITADDMETILYIAKITGVYIVDVPRSEFGDLPQDGLKFSLSFHGHFVKDDNPILYSDFNRVSPGSTDPSTFQSIYNINTNEVNNDWVKYPVITTATSTNRQLAGLGSYDYKLKWTNTRKEQ